MTQNPTEIDYDDDLIDDLIDLIYDDDLIDLIIELANSEPEAIFDNIDDLLKYLNDE